MKNISKIFNKKKTNERKLINDDLLLRENQFDMDDQINLQELCGNFVLALEAEKKKKEKRKEKFCRFIMFYS